MPCPFCQHTNAATARACRVCGAPLSAVLGATQLQIVPVAVAVTAPMTTGIARHTFAADAAELVGAGFTFAENPRVCLVRSGGAVQLWDANDNAISSFSVARLFRKLSPLCCALAMADWVATGHENGEVRWHELDGRERKSPSPHVGRVLALSANQTHLYSGGSDGVIWATETNDNKAKSRALIEGLGAMTSFAAAPDASLIAVGRDDGAVQLWRTGAEQTAAKLDWTRSGHASPVASLAFSPNGQMIISRDKTGALGLWAAQTSYQLPLPSGAHSSTVAPAFSGDSRLLALVNARNGVSIFDVALGSLFGELPPFDEPIAHLAWATASPWLLVASAQQIAVWNVI